MQPYYIIDPSRISTGAEIQRMGKLKNIIFKNHPHSKTLLLPTIYENVESIEPDEEIMEAYHFLKNHVPLGSQYYWLPSFCKQNGLRGFEISIEDGANDDIAWNNLRYLKNGFSDDPQKLSEKERKIYLASKILFQYFKFPIINLSKKETFAIAQKNGWMALMKETWFCFQPLYVPFRGLVPCGNCVTCRFQQKSGFNWRIPTYVRWLQKARKLKQKLTGSVGYI